MKVALIITDGLRSLALTPELPEENTLLELLHSQAWELTVKRGQFYISRGDYPRFGSWPNEQGKYSNEDSSILILRPKSP